LRPLQRVAVLLAGLALVLLVVLGGGVPWIAIVLAASFAFYGLVRKTVAVGATAGLMVETLALFPIALGYLLWLGRSESHALSGGPILALLAAASGPITAIPLIWFSRAARALPLSTLGLTQYVAPTGQFLVAVLLFGEAMPRLKWAAFAVIWVALVLFSIDLAAQRRQR
jgi:chloramphenicol-sensitive protein RarD